MPLAKIFTKRGFKIVATQGTSEFLKNAGIESEVIKKLVEGSNDIINNIRSGKVDLVVDIPTKGRDSQRDGFRIRRAGIEAGINVFTSLDTIKALLDVMEADLDASKVGIINLGAD